MGHQDLVLNIPLEHNRTYFIAPRIHALAVLQSMNTLAESLNHKVESQDDQGYPDLNIAWGKEISDGPFVLLDSEKY